MESRKAGHQVVRIGVFEFDVASGVLKRKGADTGLEAQPARLLGLLLGRPGEIVSRQEIQEAFWPKESPDNPCVKDRTNHAIRRIREVLQDQQETPLYIETVPKRGYKFIGQVRMGDSPEVDPDSTAPASFSRLAALLTKKWQIASAAVVGLLLISVAIAVVRKTRGPEPAITYVSPIRPRADQTIVIRGHDLGKYAPYSHTDSPYLAIRDNTVHWAAGRIMERNFDDVMLTVASWNDSEIIVTAFTGVYGHGSWKLNPGDAIEVAVWNPQTGAGPAKFHLRVSDSGITP